jgi:hypothetical protein
MQRTHYSLRQNQSSFSNATNNTVLQVVIWYKAGIPATRVSAGLILLFANPSP